MVKLDVPCLQTLYALWSTATAQRCKLAAGSLEANSTLGTSLGEKVQRGVASALADLKTLAKHPVYVLNVAATAVYTGTAWQYSIIVLSAWQCSPAAAAPLQLNLQGKPY